MKTYPMQLLLWLMIVFTVQTLYSDKPVFNFQLPSRSRQIDYIMHMSAYEDKLAISIQNMTNTNSFWNFSIINFNGEIQYSIQLLPINNYFMNWQTKLGPMFQRYTSTWQFYTLNYSSRQMIYFTNQTQSNLSSTQFSSGEYGSFIEFGYSTWNPANRSWQYIIRQYNVQSKSLQKTYSFKIMHQDSTFRSLRYSPDHRYLYAQVRYYNQDTGNYTNKVLSFSTSDGSKLYEGDTQFQLLIALDSKSYIAEKNGKIVKMNLQTNSSSVVCNILAQILDELNQNLFLGAWVNQRSNLILLFEKTQESLTQENHESRRQSNFSLLDQQPVQLNFFSQRTNLPPKNFADKYQTIHQKGNQFFLNNLSLTRPEANQGQNFLIRVINQNGKQLQTIRPDFKFRFYFTENRLAIIDQKGVVHIYSYTQDDDQIFPIWAIILITVGSLIVIGGIVGFILYRKRMAKQLEGTLLQSEDKISF